MGVSIEQWRASIGNINSRVPKKRRPPAVNKLLFVSYHMSWQLLTAIAIGAIIGGFVICSDWNGKDESQRNMKIIHYVITIMATKAIPSSISAQVIVWFLLLISGDVELNPGPISSTSLMEGLATLGNMAPTGLIKNVILTWSVDKDVRADLNKFKVDDLKTSLAWLRNWDAQCGEIKSFKKQQLIEATLIAIE